MAKRFGGKPKGGNTFEDYIYQEQRRYNDVLNEYGKAEADAYAKANNLNMRGKKVVGFNLKGNGRGKRGKKQTGNSGK